MKLSGHEYNNQIKSSLGQDSKVESYVANEPDISLRNLQVNFEKLNI
jgi:hypothetical protein